MDSDLDHDTCEVESGVLWVGARKTGLGSKRNLLYMAASVCSVGVSYKFHLQVIYIEKRVDFRNNLVTR